MLHSPFVHFSVQYGIIISQVRQHHTGLLSVPITMFPEAIILVYDTQLFECEGVVQYGAGEPSSLPVIHVRYTSPTFARRRRWLNYLYKVVKFDFCNNL